MPLPGNIPVFPGKGLQNGQPGIFIAGQIAYPYVIYDVKVRYVWDAGQLPLPVAYNLANGAVAAPSASPSNLPYKSRQAAVLVRHSNATGLKIVTFILARLGTECIAPDATTTNPNEVLLWADFQSTNPVPSSDGMSLAYTMAGVYIYSLKQPLYTNDTLDSASSQADITQPSDNALDSGNFAQGIV